MAGEPVSAFSHVLPPFSASQPPSSRTPTPIPVSYSPRRRIGSEARDASLSQPRFDRCLFAPPARPRRPMSRARLDARDALRVCEQDREEGLKLALQQAADLEVYLDIDRPSEVKTFTEVRTFLDTYNCQHAQTPCIQYHRVPFCDHSAPSERVRLFVRCLFIRLHEC